MVRAAISLIIVVFWNLGFTQGLEDRPNIMLIVADDLGFTDLGSFGGEISTPNLDELAFAGVRLNNLHAAQTCQLSRAMLMASAPEAHALEQMPPQPSGQRANRLSLEWASLPELLQDAGYRTYMAGKWDLGISGEYTPARRGFDRSFAMLEASASHFAEFFWIDKVLYEDDGRALSLDDLPQDFYSTRFYTDKILEYLQAHEDAAPWFAYVPYTAPHWPLQVPDDWRDRYVGRYDAGYDALREERMAHADEQGVMPAGGSPETFEPFAQPWTNLTADERREHSRAQEIYAAMVEYVDTSIGRIVEYLESSGQLDNTVIVFMSDHGASAAGITMDDFSQNIPGRDDNSLNNFGRRGSFIDHGAGFAEAATAPLKYFKNTLSEGGLRAAAFVRYPKTIPGGGVADSFLTFMDILPTFLDIAGTSHPGAVQYRGRQIHEIRGRSFWPYLRGEAVTVHSPTDTAGWTQLTTGALIRGDYKIISQSPPRSGSGIGMGSVEPSPWRLYNIVDDPGEKQNLAAEYPDLTAELVEEWEDNWR